MNFLLLTVIIFSISVVLAQLFFSCSIEYAEDLLISGLTSIIKRSFLPLLMLLYFVQTSAVFHTGCWNKRKNKKTKISRASKKEYEIEQKKPELVRVRQWADEDDFRLFVYLKLDELIQNGQAGVEAVEEGEESNPEDNNKRDNQDNKTKTVNITYINGDNSNTTTDIITDSSMNTNINTSSTTIRATATTDAPITRRRRTTTITTTTTATTTTTTTTKSANRTPRNTKLSTRKSSLPTPPTLLKLHNKSANERPPTTISTLLAEITQNTDKINKKIESLILEGTRALQSDWRDFSKQDRMYDNIDDVGVDLDYFTFLASIPDAFKKIENQKGAWAVARERFRILRIFLRGLI